MQKGWDSCFGRESEKNWGLGKEEEELEEQLGERADDDHDFFVAVFARRIWVFLDYFGPLVVGVFFLGDAPGRVARVRTIRFGFCGRARSDRRICALLACR